MRHCSLRRILLPRGSNGLEATVEVLGLLEIKHKGTSTVLRVPFATQRSHVAVDQQRLPVPWIWSHVQTMDLHGLSYWGTVDVWDDAPRTVWQTAMMTVQDAVSLAICEKRRSHWITISPLRGQTHAG